MGALEAEFNGEQVYTTPLHNILGVKNILTTMMESMPKDQLQRTPGLRCALSMVNATAIQN